MNSNICIKNIIRMLIFFTFLIAFAPQKISLAEDNLPALEDYVFYSSWGGDGKQILQPEDVAVGNDGKIYVTNTGLNRITTIDKSGFIYNEIGGFDSVNSEIEFASSVAVNADGEILVADARKHRIQIFDNQGNHLLTWGEEGSNPGQFNGPCGISFDSDGNVYIADSGNHRIQKFTSDRVFLKSLGTQGSYNNQFYSPRDVAINSNGEIYVADTFNARIQRFSSKWEHMSTITIEDPISSGNLIKPFGIAIGPNDQLIVTGNYKVYIRDTEGNPINEWGDFGGKLGEFYNPLGVDVDENGVIYVADQNNNRIQMFDLDGNFVNAMGVDQKTPGYFYFPSGITIVNHYVYVADGGNNRIQKFNQDGTFLLSWGVSGMDSGQFNHPNGIDGDSFGNIFVVDSYNHRVQKFDPNGAFLISWGGNGAEEGKFYIPRGLAIDHNDNIFIVDSGNNRIQKFNSSIEMIKSWGVYGSGDGQFSNPNGIAVDSNGNVFVADMYNSRVQKFNNDGEFITQWNFIRDPNSPLYFGNTWGITVDSNDDIYVSGVYVPEIRKYSNDGEFLGFYGSKGIRPGEFRNASEIAINNEGVLYISDRANQRVQVISPFSKEVDPEFGLVANGGFESEPEIKMDLGIQSQLSNNDLSTTTGLIALEIPALSDWTYGGSLPISISDNAQQGFNALQLGGAVDQVPQGIGDAWAYQVIYVKSEWFFPVLSFKYNVVTNDYIELSDFLVEIQDGVGLNHLASVVRDGFQSEIKKTLPDPGTDLGWKTITYDLSAFRGQTIRLIFSNRNLLPDSKGAWSFVDDVVISDETERVFLPLINR